jgi:protein TonB
VLQCSPKFGCLQPNASRTAPQPRTHLRRVAACGFHLEQTMAAHLLRFPSATFDWRRVGAFSTTLAAHAAALALILMPLAAPIERSLQRTIEVTFVEAPPPLPKLPPPPEPEPLRKPPRPTAAPPRPLPPQPPVPVAVAQAPSPVQAPVATIPTPPVAVDPAPSTPPAPAGETRRLAYDGQLQARYPAASLRAREQGTVVLRVLVDAQGRVERVEVARSSGHPKLDAAARDAVSKARFKPVLSAGTPIPAWGLVPIEFRLDRA